MFWSIADWADSFGWSVKRSRRRLMKTRPCAIYQVGGPGGHWQMSRATIKAAFPDDWPDIIARLPA